MNGRLLLALALLLAACFSERAEPTALGAVDCSLPLDSLTVGRVGVVVIRNFAFHPAELRVPAGTRVTWINCETAANGRTPHTTTADAGAWGSPLLAFEATYSAVFDATGTFAYHCEPHPVMTGRVIVE
jgi:plastocyanin